MSANDTAKIVGETININDGGAFMITGQTVNIKDGGAAIITGENVTITDGGSALLLANSVEMNDGGAMFLIARYVGGNAKVLFDVKAAVIFGVVVGLILSVLRFVLSEKDN